MNSKILLVDDDENILEACERSLRQQPDFSLDTALGGAEGLKREQTDGPYGVVVADMQMPKMNGIEFLNQMERRRPDTVRIMLTGNADQRTVVEAINQGRIFRFLNKPCSTQTLVQAMQAGLKQHHLITAERELLEKTLNGAVKIVTDVLSAVDPHAFGRGRHLRETVRAFLQEFPVEKPWEVELAAMLSPIGRVTLPPSLLAKERNGITLTVPENEMFLRVPEVGAELLQQIPRLGDVAALVRLQHKGYDGSGRPALAPAGNALPMGARILKVLGDLTAFEFSGTTKAVALRRLRESPEQYDPAILALVTQELDGDPALAKKPGLPVDLPVESLQTGHTLVWDLKTLDNMLVAPAGTVLSSLLVERLKNFCSLGSIVNTVTVRM